MIGSENHFWGQGMKIVTTKSAIQPALSLAAKVADAVSVGETIEAMSPEVAVRMRYDGEKDGQFLTPSKKLLDVVSTCGEDIVFEGEDSITIQSGSSKAQLDWLSQDPPLIQKPSGLPYVVPSDVLSDAIKKTTFCCARESAQYVLAGIHINAGGGMLRLESTDTMRLSSYAVEVDTDETMDLVVCQHAIPLMSALTGSVSLGEIDGRLCCMTESMTMIAATIQGKFPDAATVIDHTASQRQTTVDRTELINALQFVSNIVPTETRCVALESDGATLVLSTDSGRTETKCGGSTGETRLNVDYLMQAVKHCPSEVGIALEDGKQAAMIDDGIWLHCISPIFSPNT